MILSCIAARLPAPAVEWSRPARCAAAIALFVGGTAFAQTLSTPPGASAQAGVQACLLAQYRVDPVTFARARSRHPHALQDCTVDAVGDDPGGDGVPVAPSPASVRILPPAAATDPGARSTPQDRGAANPSPLPELSDRPAPDAPGADTPASGRRSPPTQGRVFTDRMRALAPQVNAVARRNEIDPLLLHALIHVESRHRTDAVSPAGARGPMQLMPQTAARFGVHTVGHLHEVPFNLAAGAAYLKMLQGEFGGDLDLALAAYNAGEGAVRRHGGRIPPYPETRTYVRDVRAMYRRLQIEWQSETMAAGTDGAAPLALSEARP
jgi:hypothetical protein